jgi:hypothetical protein
LIEYPNREKRSKSGIHYTCKIEIWWIQKIRVLPLDSIPNLISSPIVQGSERERGGAERTREWSASGCVGLYIRLALENIIKLKIKGWQWPISRRETYFLGPSPMVFSFLLKFKTCSTNNILNTLSRWCPLIKSWDQKIYFFCNFRFELCDCLYNGHWRLTWSLISCHVGLVEVRASWAEHPR